MTKILALLLLALFPVAPTPPQASVVPEITITDVAMTPPEVLPVDNTALILGLINRAAAKYKVDPAVMWQVINCECPSLKPDCPSDVIRKDGSEEPSIGLAQIDADYHPEITYSQRTDPAYSVSFMAEYMAEGKYSTWACYGILKASNKI